MIRKYQRVLAVLTDKKNQISTDSTDYAMYTTYINFYQDELKSLRSKYLVKYLYGTGTAHPFDKKDLLALVYAADLYFPGDISHNYDVYLPPAVHAYVQDDIL